MKKIVALLAGVALSTMSITAAHAADTHYSEWTGSQTINNPNQLVERLNRLIDTAERQRAADPRFLQDLRDALGAYAVSQVPVFIKDGFTDGDISRDPAWTIASGKFGLERNGGLRSIVQPSGSASSQSGKQDGASAILDTILGSGKKSSSGGSLISTQRAEIFTGAKITNAFQVSSSLISRTAPGQFDWVVYQGTDRSSGYRLSYVPDAASPSFELLRFSRKGSSVIDSFEAQGGLEDGRTHDIRWTRTGGGVMSITLDGQEILTVTDQSIKSGFDGLALVNAGGDVTIRHVEVIGVL